MIHGRRTFQIAPGRPADMVARTREWIPIFKEEAGVDLHVSVVTPGTLGRICLSADFESMGAREAANAKGQALFTKDAHERREGTLSLVDGTSHDEVWRSS